MRGIEKNAKIATKKTANIYTNPGVIFIYLCAHRFLAVSCIQGDARNGSPVTRCLSWQIIRYYLVVKHSYAHTQSLFCIRERACVSPRRLYAVNRYLTQSFAASGNVLYCNLFFLFQYKMAFPCIFEIFDFNLVELLHKNVI